jgi:hypothetical protein
MMAVYRKECHISQVIVLSSKRGVFFNGCGHQRGVSCKSEQEREECLALVAGYRDECHVLVLSKREECLAMVACYREECYVIVLSKREECLAMVACYREGCYVIVLSKREECLAMVACYS